MRRYWSSCESFKGKGTGFLLPLTLALCHPGEGILPYDQLTRPETSACVLLCGIADSLLRQVGLQIREDIPQTVRLSGSGSLYATLYVTINLPTVLPPTISVLRQADGCVGQGH